MNLLKWNLYTQQQTVAEGIPMQEVHIVFWIIENSIPLRNT